MQQHISDLAYYFRRGLCLLAVFALMSISAYSQDDYDEIPFTLKLTAIDEQTNKMQGVQISIFNEKGLVKEKKTDIGGYAEFELPYETEYYKVFFIKTGYVKQHFVVYMNSIPKPALTKMKFKGAGIIQEVMLTKNDGSIEEWKYDYPFDKYIYDGKKGVMPDPAYHVQFEQGTAPELVKGKEDEKKKEKEAKEEEQAKKVADEKMLKEKIEQEARRAEDKKRQAEEAEKAFDELQKKQQEAKQKLAAQNKKSRQKDTGPVMQESSKETSKGKKRARAKQLEQPEEKIIAKQQEKSTANTEQEQQSEAMITDEVKFKKEESEQEKETEENKLTKTTYENEIVKSAAQAEKTEKEKELEKLIEQKECEEKVEALASETNQKTTAIEYYKEEKKKENEQMANKVAKQKELGNILMYAAKAEREEKEKKSSATENRQKQEYTLPSADEYSIKVSEDFLKTTTTTTVRRGVQNDTYVKEVSSWETSYYKNGKEISAREYGIELSRILKTEK